MKGGKGRPSFDGVGKRGKKSKRKKKINRRKRPRGRLELKAYQPPELPDVSEMLEAMARDLSRGSLSPDSAQSTNSTDLVE